MGCLLLHIFIYSILVVLSGLSVGQTLFIALNQFLLNEAEDFSFEQEKKMV